MSFACRQLFFLVCLKICAMRRFSSIATALCGIHAHQDALLVPDRVGPGCQWVRFTEVVPGSEIAG